MLGYYYDIIYNKAKENVLVNALSRQFEEDGYLFALSLSSPSWLEEVRQNG